MDYTLSSNPPNPKSSFRHGDWICPLKKCAAHNFGRNQACIGCGCPRSSLTMPMPSHDRDQVFYSSAQPQWTVNSSSLPFPSANPPALSTATTITANNNPRPPLDLSQITSQLGSLSLGKPQLPPKPTTPLLTPSGRAFAIGGRVQNISSDPLTPCIMWWPDNEPFPEQGQIRPSNVVGIAPPILNTGNRGPISHQPGDWICQKCNYLNWRRRKVCQTCLPYAEGNGDSISAAVQAERIALLTQVLSQTSHIPSSTLHQSSHGQSSPLQQTNQLLPSQNASPQQHQLNVPAHASRSHSMTPPQVRSRVPHLSAGALASSGLPMSTQQQHLSGQPGGLGSNAFTPGLAGRSVQRSRSHLSLGSTTSSASTHHQQHATNAYPSATAAAAAAAAAAASASPIYQTGVRPARATTLAIGQMQHQHQQAEQQQRQQRLQIEQIQLLQQQRELELQQLEQRRRQRLHSQLSSMHQQNPRQQQREPSPLYSTGPLPGAYTFRLSPAPSGSSSMATPGPMSSLIPISASSTTTNANANGTTTASATTTNATTTPHRQLSPPASSSGALEQEQEELYNSNTISVHAPAPLLPAFLQDMVQTPPSLSPASNASSSSVSLDETESDSLSAASPVSSLSGKMDLAVRRPRVSSGSTDSSGSGGSNGLSATSIWKMDGEEMGNKLSGMVPMYVAGANAPAQHGRETPASGAVGVIGAGRFR